MSVLSRFRKRTSKTEDVLLVILCGGHQAHASLVQLASECDRFSARTDHRFTIQCVPITAAPQELARNTACGMALERLRRPTDTLLMVDHDMIQHGWRTLQILDTQDYDIAGGLQYMWLPRDHETKREPDARPCAFMRRPDGVAGQTCVYPKPGEKQAEVDRVGSGLMAIKRRVLADARMLLAEGYDPPALWRNVYEPNFVRQKGLDMDFCDRARALGWRVVVNWQAEAGHNKTVNLNEVDEYAKAQFVQGYELGVRHALSMGATASGQAKGTGGGPGPSGPNGHGVAGAGLDRAGGLTAAAHAGAGSDGGRPFGVGAAADPASALAEVAR